MTYATTSTARRFLPLTWVSAVLVNGKEAAARRNRYLDTLRVLESMTDRDLADINISRLQIRDVAHEAAYGKAR